MSTPNHVRYSVAVGLAFIAVTNPGRAYFSVRCLCSAVRSMADNARS